MSRYRNSLTKMVLLGSASAATAGFFGYNSIVRQYTAYNRQRQAARDAQVQDSHHEQGAQDDMADMPASVSREEMWQRLILLHQQRQRQQEGESEGDVQMVSRGGSEKNATEPMFDVVVIGGGATGSGCAVDAASRGYRVALFERGDFASGTSSRATKMAHGGVRYLEKAVMSLDPQELSFVRDCLHERRHFFRVAPHLTRPLPLLTPCYSWFEAAKMYAGLRLYDIMSGIRGVEDDSDDQRLQGTRIGPGSYWMSARQVAQMVPGLVAGTKDAKDDDNNKIASSLPSRLVGGVVYHDAVFNDARLNVALAITAAHKLGAVVLNHCEVVGLIKEKEGDDSDVVSRVTGVVVRDRLTGREQHVSARVVVNATGVYTDAIRQMDDPQSEPMARPSMGVHITMDADRFCPNDGQTGILVPRTPDGRVMFVVPWEGRCIVGTTDVETHLSETPAPREEDIEFICNTMREYYSIPISRSDVRSAWAGIRPLVVQPAPTVGQKSSMPPSSPATSTASVPRDHLIDVSSSDLVTIAGGKWTSFRLMAQEAIDTAAKVANLPERESKSEVTPLVGAVHWKRIASHPLLSEDQPLDEDVQQHLKHFYGDRAPVVAKLARDRNLAQRLSDSLPLIEAEIVYQVHHEMACKPTDVIAYRTNLMFLDREEAMRAVPRVTELMGQELGWSHHECEKYRREALEYIVKCTR